VTSALFYNNQFINFTVQAGEMIAKLIFIRCFLMDDNSDTNAASGEAFLKGKALIRNEQLMEDEITL
jgi:hypothetical protein